MSKSDRMPEMTALAMTAEQPGAASIAAGHRVLETFGSRSSEVIAESLLINAGVILDSAALHDMAFT